MWDYQPWDNDRAADFFADVMGHSGFVEKVRNGIKEVLSAEYIDDELCIARACAYCLIHFGRVYIWPIDHLNSDLRLCITALQRGIEEEGDEKLVSLVENEIKELETRLASLES